MEATNKIKILFFIPVWRRLKITEACYKGLKRFIEYIGDRAQCETLIVYSEEAHKRLLMRYGWHGAQCTNKPVGNKFNKGMEHALNNFDFDYVFQLNSDNLLDNALFDVFYKAMSQGVQFASIEDLYFYNSQTGEMKAYKYTLNGCGIRVISRNWIAKAGWHQYCNIKKSGRGAWISYTAGTNKQIPIALTRKAFIEPLSQKKTFLLWPKDANKGLDNASRNTLFGAFGEPVGWIRTTQRPMVIDIKSKVNIWSYDQLLHGRDLSGEEVQGLLKYFPELESIVLSNVLERQREENM